jgi:hypothetical protein
LFHRELKVLGYLPIALLAEIKPVIFAVPFSEKSELMLYMNALLLQDAVFYRQFPTAAIANHLD